VNNKGLPGAAIGFKTAVEKNKLTGNWQWEMY
jgi:hypothetical protein